MEVDSFGERETWPSSGGKEDSETFSFDLAVAILRKLVLLRVRLICGSPKQVLRILYTKIVQLCGSSFLELVCSVLLQVGVTRS